MPGLVIVNLPIKIKGNSKRTPGNQLSPLEPQNKDIGATSHTFLTEVNLRLQRRLIQTGLFGGIPKTGGTSEAPLYNLNTATRIRLAKLTQHNVLAISSIKI